MTSGLTDLISLNKKIAVSLFSQTEDNDFSRALPTKLSPHIKFNQDILRANLFSYLINVGGLLLKIAVNVLKVQSGARTRVYGVADRRPTTWLSALIYQESPLVNLQKRPDS